ncbi:unnamed protein product [Lymnaea stagnalis]|uniref:TNFR-Cys domain-containing protein n=1 Tax=Lymnaea stagnalis TaxID=6523 RepID=A0AAV2HYS7_LYMST
MYHGWTMSPDLTYIAALTLHLLTQSAVQTQSLDNSCDKNIPSRAMPAVQLFGRAYAVSDIQPTVCGEGEYLDWFTCKPCEDGTFMTQKMAETKKYAFCQKCYQPGMFEIVTEPCTKTRDAKIMCEDGYYRCEVPGKPCQTECRRCDVCGLGINMFKNYEVRECSGDQNTICCHRENMVLVNGECVMKTTVATTTTYTETTSGLSSTTTESGVRSQNSAMGTAAVLHNNSQLHLIGLLFLILFYLFIGIS